MKVVRYELGARLAVGGMAEVFLASAVLPDGNTRTVVVKRILPQCSDDKSFIHMFLDEATITGRLDHPNIVRLLDMGRMDEQLFLALEYVPGMDLEELVLLVRERGQRLTVGLAAYIVCEVLKGLHHAHTRTSSDGKPLFIVHRDVTPANVLLGLDGTVKMSDFGIAKAAVRYAGTNAGVIKGNFQFISPEQISGKAVDHRADVYGVGMTLRVLLTGQLPFDGESIPVMIDRVSRGEFLPISAIDPETPPKLDAIVRKATAPKLEDRYATADEFRLALWGFAKESGDTPNAADLAAVLADGRRGKDDVRFLGSRSHVIERSASEPNELSVFRTSVSAQRGSAPKVIDTDVATRAGVSPAPPTPTFRPAGPRPMPPPAEMLAPRPPSPAPPPPSFAPPPPIEMLEVTPSQLEVTPTTVLPPPPFMDIKALEAAAVTSPTIRESTVVSPSALMSTEATGPIPTIPVPSALPNVGVIPPGRDVTNESDAELLLGDVDDEASTSKAIPVPASPTPAAAPAPVTSPLRPAVFPSGPLPASLITQDCVRIPAHRQSVSAVAFAANGVLVSGGNDQTVRVWDLTRPAETACLRGHTGAVTCVASGAGGLIVSGSRDKTARTWRLGSDKSERTFAGHTQWVFAVAISPDGLLVASGGMDRTVRLWDVGTGSLRRILEGHTDAVSSVTFLPDGRILSASYDQTLRLWRLDGSLERVIGGKVGPIRAVVYHSTDCAVSAGADGFLHVWDLATGRLTGTMGPHDGPVVSLAAIPRAAIVASASYDGTARLWDLRSLKELGRTTLENAVTALSPAPAGAFLAMGNGDGSLALWAPPRAAQAFFA